MRWIIDVCKTCGREAKWPFCEHRPSGYTSAAAEPWCMAITVTASAGDARRLKAAMAERAVPT